MKIVVYVASECRQCHRIVNGLEALEYPLTVLNGLSEEHDAILDRYDVDRLPFVQILDDKGDIVWHKSGDKNVTLKDIVDAYAVEYGTRTSG